MSYEDILDKIVEETEASEEDIEEEVDEKMEEFEGLVSEEGAIHLVAKEYGVQVGEAGSQDLKIENIVPEMRKVNLKARVLNILDMNTFERDGEEEEGKVQNIVLGDDTGTIRVTLWDEQTEIADKIEEGDPIQISGAYTVEDDQGNAEIRLGDESQVAMADEEDVPEVESSSSSGSMSEVAISEVATENAQYRINGMLVAMYTSNPFYRVDPETGDTVREDDDGDLVTDEGKEVEEPDHRLAVSGVIDDGTGVVRTVFFGEQARKILGVDEETEREGDQEAVEEAAEEIIGKELQVEGRTRYNDYFDQIEIIANSVEELEPEEQIENLLELMEA
jgi:replication factor A1